jgi:hypothetical protein
MRFDWYPENLDPPAEAAVKRFITKDLKKQAELLMRVKEFLKKVQDADDLQPFFSAGTMGALSSGLFEMRIPPRRNGGVVRIYFCRNPKDKGCLVLLDAEFKNETAGARIDVARDRLSKFMSFVTRI